MKIFWQHFDGNKKLDYLGHVAIISSEHKKSPEGFVTRVHLIKHLVSQETSRIFGTVHQQGIWAMLSFTFWLHLKIEFQLVIVVDSHDN